jgi:hypothetical protein
VGGREKEELGHNENLFAIVRKRFVSAQSGDRMQGVRSVDGYPLLVGRPGCNHAQKILPLIGNRLPDIALASHVLRTGSNTFREVRRDALSRGGLGSVRGRGLSRGVWPSLEETWVARGDERLRPAGRKRVAAVVARPLLAQTSSKAYDSFLCQSSPAQAQTVAVRDAESASHVCHVAC